MSKKPQSKRQNSKKTEIRKIIQEKKNNLYKLIEPQVESVQKSNFNGVADYQQKIYFQNLERLQNAKLKVIQLSNLLQQNKIELSYETEAYHQLNQHFKRTQNYSNQVQTEIRAKHQREKLEMRKIYEERLNRNLEHLDQLLSDKSKHNQRMMQFVARKQDFEETIKRQKDQFVEDLKTNKESWAKIQKEKRQKWEQNQFQIVRASTLKGIQPNIQKIIRDGKQQSKNIISQYERAMEDYRAQKVQEHDQLIRELREQQSKRLQNWKDEMLKESQQKLQKQYIQFQTKFEEDRQKMRKIYSEDIRKLQQSRKQETEEFIRNNKHFYMDHLNEMRSIKQGYELQIRQLDGAFAEGTSKHEQEIDERLNKWLKQCQQGEKEILKRKLQQLSKDIKRKSAEQYQDLVQKVARQNDQIEMNIRGEIQKQIQAGKNDNEKELKSLKKTLKSLNLKAEAVDKENSLAANETETIQDDYLQEKRQLQINNRKIEQLQQQENKLKIASDSIALEEAEALKRVNQRWEAEIAKMVAKIKEMQQQVEKIGEIMVQRMDENQLKKLNDMNRIESEVIKLNNRRDQQIVKLKAQKNKLLQLRDSYKQMIQKQDQMLKKYKKISN